MKYIVRLYDAELDKCVRERFSRNKDKFPSMNAFITDLIRTGLQESSPVRCSSDENELLSEIVKLLKDNSRSNAVLRSLLCSVYSLLLAHNDEGYLSRSKVEQGFYDELPDRFKEKK